LRRRTYPNEKFDFLGYTFQPRRSKNRKGKFFINFSPAVANKAAKAMRDKIRSWNLPRRSDKAIEDLSRMFNPMIRGWVQYYGRYYRSAKAIARFKERIRKQTRRTGGISLTQMVKEITTYLRGWLGYFGDCQTPSVLHSLETWLRRRLRSVGWKQWQRGRTRFRELRKRGVSKALAAKTAGSPHSPWRLANSPALAIAFPNAYFAKLGLPPMVVRS
jgi:hypothetical protein